MNKLEFQPFPILKTDRLVLRKLKPEDDQLIYNYRSNKIHFIHVDMPEYKSIVEAQKYIEIMNAGVDDNKWIIWAISDMNDEILGTISIWNFQEDNSVAELGYGLFPGNTGKGIMTEAMNKVVEYAINDMHLKWLDAYTGKDNLESIGLLKRCNFEKVSDFLETETVSGKPLEMVIYRVK